MNKSRKGNPKRKIFRFRWKAWMYCITKQIDHELGKEVSKKYWAEYDHRIMYGDAAVAADGRLIPPEELEIPKGIFDGSIKTS